jgi:hypothetical protein
MHACRKQFIGKEYTDGQRLSVASNERQSFSLSLAVKVTKTFVQLADRRGLTWHNEFPPILDHKINCVSNPIPLLIMTKQLFSTIGAIDYKTTCSNSKNECGKLCQMAEVKRKRASAHFPRPRWRLLARLLSLPHVIFHTKAIAFQNSGQGTDLTPTKRARAYCLTFITSHARLCPS